MTRVLAGDVLHRVEAVLERSGFVDVVGPEHFWHSISQCVRAARRDTGLKGEGRRPVDANDAEPEQPVDNEAEVLDEDPADVRSADGTI